MATITPRTNKDGSVSYRIRVFGGRDSEGRQRVFQTTWKPDTAKSDSKNQKDLNKFAAAYEAECLAGAVVEQKVLFGKYCRQLVDDKQKNGAIKANTAVFYRGLYPLLHDIDGVPLPQINANVLNKLYRNLLDTPAVSCIKYRLRPKIDLLKLGDVPNKTQFSHKYGIAVSTLNTTINRNNVSQATAEKLSEALGLPLSQMFVSESSQITVSPSQIHKVHSLVSMVLSEALKDGLVTQNCAERVRLPKAEKKAPRYLDTDEIGELLQAAGSEPWEIKLFIYLAVATGARRGELLGLQWEDVDFTFGQLEIKQAVYYRPATGLYIDTPKNKSSRRFIRLPAEIMAMLREYKQEWERICSDCGSVYPQTVTINDGSGKPKEYTADFVFFQTKCIGLPHAPDTANKWLTAVCKKNGIAHVNPHALRHSAASALIFGGVDPASVAKYLGHTSPQTTEKVYAHALEESRNRNAEVIGSFMFGRKKDNKPPIEKIG